MQELSRLSQNYADPAIAVKQREMVDRQLEAMYGGRTHRYFSLVGEIANRIRRESGWASATLLDAACGSAYYSEVIEFLSPGWIKYTGVDYNPGMVDLARVYYPSLWVVWGNVLDLQFGDDAFDIVLSSATIGHIRDWPRALGELVRVSRSWLVLHRNAIWLDGTPTVCDSRRDYDTEVIVHRFGKQSIVDEADLLGMELVELYEVSPPRGSEGYYTYLFRKHR